MHPMDDHRTDDDRQRDDDQLGAVFFGVLGALLWVFGFVLYEMVGAGTFHVMDTEARVILAVGGFGGTGCLLTAAGAWRRAARAGEQHQNRP